jgi:arsenate reductase (thioredoxin)
MNVLFLCTGNSARSIIAEALLAQLGGARFQSFSAGSHPSGKVQPLAAEIAMELGYPEAKLRSKSQHEFETGATAIDLVVTVCGNANEHACPYFPGAPLRAHWGVDDPVAISGDEAQRRAAFRSAYAILRRRVEALIALPLAHLSPTETQAALDQIGELP